MHVNRKIDKSLPRKKWSPEVQQAARKRVADLHAARAHESPSHALLAELRLARTWIKADRLQEEPKLAASCWIEYAYLSAVERTELFTRVYDEMFRNFHGRYVDFHSKDDISPINVEYAANSQGEMESLWRARQYADVLGMPYGTFIGQAIECTAQIEGHKKLPRPNQLYSDRPLEHVVSYWDEFRKTVSLFDDNWDVRFFAQHFRGDPVQLRALALIEDRVLKVPANRRAMNIANYLVRKGVITETEARIRFGDQLVNEAIVIAGSVPRANPAASSTYYRPSCLGLALQPAAAACSLCPMFELCAKFTEVLDREFKIKWGDVEPKAAMKRQNARDRKRKQRHFARLGELTRGSQSHSGSARG